MRDGWLTHPPSNKVLFSRSIFESPSAPKTVNKQRGFTTSFAVAPDCPLITGGRVGALVTERFKISAHFVVCYDIVQV